MPLDKIAQSVRSFYESNGDGFDASRPRLNILLWGPPGAGKTEFAKFLAAKSGHKLRVKTGSGLLSKWVGGTEHNIANAFKDAEDDRAILFLDEIDGLVQARGRSNLFLHILRFMGAEEIRLSFIGGTFAVKYGIMFHG